MWDHDTALKGPAGEATISRPVYSQIADKSTLKENCRILRNIWFFSVFSHRPGAMLFIDVLFAAMGYWKVPAAILVACRWFGNGRLHCAGLRFVFWQEHSFPHCFGTFSVSSSLFYFVLSENNQNNFTVASEKWWMLVLCSGNISLALNCLRIQCRDYTKHNTQTEPMAVRGCGTYTCAIENPEMGMFQTGKQTKRKICLEIFMTAFFNNFRTLKI